jgi:hypothetical protein
MKVTSDQDARSDEENTSKDTGDSGNTSDNGGYVKICAEAALAGISYDFGLSKVTISHITSLKKSARYFPKGFAWSPSVESVPAPQENEAVQNFQKNWMWRYTKASNEEIFERLH